MYYLETWSLNVHHNLMQHSPFSRRKTRYAMEGHQWQ
jgi:hypothetical protein